MPRYLYTFGFNTPQQIEAFNKYGYDDEDSEEIFIEADSEDAALAWGVEISKEFIRQVYGDQGLVWKPSDYAHRIESEPGRVYTPGVLRRLLVVRVGEHPPPPQNGFLGGIVHGEVPDNGLD